ncbi:cytochrome b561 and DOMON domain-containing protein At5g47530 [Sorghum bicolor]|uniref:DOMON domain-containing protein n=1 Tax=Sorghum bicolor TaxID=4558 RepID=A0A1Z5SBD4_SORBI|nr:cytochrome b561 and DOMON domain-containing protein At5g47530 [Sorghum bicolor]OQU93075.1 hypothetical protein SORBI_3001G471300 [Sorghum bicolor]|eukprot:XP_002468342.1 cytochrome b561 and DOMON domain-containing protein At5g47530 [Sorghum bicolor]
MAGAGRNQSAWLLLAAVLVLFASSTATAQQEQEQNCSSAKFSSDRSFQRCTSLPVLGASLYWTYHAANGTADVAFRAPSDPSGWVAWGINPTSGGSMVGSSVFIASQAGGNGAVSVLMTYLESSAIPSLTNNTLRFAVPVGPAAEYSGGAYTIYATVALPGNRTVQNTVWQAGPLSGGGIASHPMAPANLQSTQKLDFLSGGSQSTGAGATKSRGLLARRNLRGFQG